MNQPPKDKRTKEYKQWLKNNPQGLGDKVNYLLNETPIESVTNAIKKAIFKEGEDCGCDKRREILNKLMPSKLVPVRCFTEQEYEDYKHFKDVRTLVMQNDQIDFVAELYSDIFAKQYFKPCPGCSPKPLIRMIEMLDKVFDSYEKEIE